MSASGSNRALRLAQRRRMNFYMHTLGERALLAENITEAVEAPVASSQEVPPASVPADFSLLVLPEVESASSVPA